MCSLYTPIILTYSLFPGVINLKAHQDDKLPKEDHYIRRIIAVDINPDDELAMNEDIDDADDTAKKDDKLRIIVCMTPEASRRLRASGRYLQSDIGFKRIVGFKEFEVASMERDANTSTSSSPSAPFHLSDVYRYCLCTNILE